MQSEEPTIIQSLENHLAEYGHTTVGQDIAAAILVIKDFHQKAALSAASPVASIVPDHCSGSVFVFEGGCLHVRKDGSGYIVVDEDDFALEDDRCEGEHGPEGSVHWIARFPAGEMTSLRDFLNGQGFSALSAQLQDVARDLPSEFEKWWDDAGHYVGGVVKMTYTQRKQLAWDAFYASANPAAPAKQEG